MNEREIAAKALALIEDPNRWTKGVFARDAKGNECDPCDPDATCFCAVGAVRRVLNFKLDNMGMGDEVYWSVLRFIRGPFGLSVASTNDWHGHAAVVAKLKKAIAS